ncbi:hypothetical protein BU26DRAFT_322320 [Trematosphaeria pertusa]|uniref:Uncharacterized protein n=1 Tax=Trematosphaeria pertusa TaxID=390896 RepID=A0A6A6IEE1_9PLEO|nr:uncharacterized protein BU26DRAFT_322320 [Trematosphaeria pertusa]KAF2247873.1 hypothetical protein BU26DRAFT_322320 [Trematosphaeria pertusa]
MPRCVDLGVCLKAADTFFDEQPPAWSPSKTCRTERLCFRKRTLLGIHQFGIVERQSVRRCSPRYPALPQPHPLAMEDTRSAQTPPSASSAPYLPTASRIPIPIPIRLQTHQCGVHTRRRRPPAKIKPLEPSNHLMRKGEKSPQK